jgi:hypothetical protein
MSVLVWLVLQSSQGAASGCIAVETLALWTAFTPAQAVAAALSIWPSKFECEWRLITCTENAHRTFLLGLRNRLASFRPNSTATRPARACVSVPDPNCSEPSREGRASVCNRAVQRRSSGSARYIRMGDSDYSFLCESSFSNVVHTAPLHTHAAHTHISPPFPKVVHSLPHWSLL